MNRRRRNWFPQSEKLDKLPDLGSARVRHPALLEVATIMLFTTLVVNLAFARQYDHRTAVHSQGNIQLRTSNFGLLVTHELDNILQTPVDPITGEFVNHCMYPRGSYIRYMQEVSLHLGTIVENDTLVTNAFETGAAEPPFGAFYIKSSDPSSPYFSESARSQLDLSCVQWDTNYSPPAYGWDLRENVP